MVERERLVADPSGEQSLVAEGEDLDVAVAHAEVRALEVELRTFEAPHDGEPNSLCASAIPLSRSRVRWPMWSTAPSTRGS